MRLTMCAREECGICKYKDTCDFDFQYNLATENMNILADALRADRKTEPQAGEMMTEEEFDSMLARVLTGKDEPQTDIHGLTDCDFCKERNCEDCEGGKDEPQTDCAWGRSE